MTHILPYIMPLLLGRTFNLDTMDIGIDIFSKDIILNPDVIQNPVTETKYKIVDNAIESRNLLDVEGSFSLKVKAGIFKGGVSGAYLSDKYNKENTVEVAVKATYQVMTEQLPADAKPFDNLKQLGGALGTHYVRSITYGGELIASIRMICNNTRDKQRIAAALDVGGKFEIFDFGVEAEGEYMKEISKSVESTQIKFFSSIPLSKLPNDMKSLKEALNNFPNDVKSFNGGKGVPIRMELAPIQLLDSSFPTQLRNRVLEANLDSFEQKFDDLLSTKLAISDWMKITSQSLTVKQEKQVGNLYEEVNKKIRTFYEVIGALDLSKAKDQLKKAENAYGLSIPGIYFKKYRLLRQEMAHDQGEWSLSRGKGTIYTHWGKSNCSQFTEKISDGSVVGPQGFGAGANFLCLSPESRTEEVSLSNKKNVAPLQDTSYQLPNSESRHLTCSTCRLGARGTVETFVGRKDCPDDWDMIYDGLLLSGAESSSSTKFICLDKDPEESASNHDKNVLRTDWALKTGDEDESQILLTCAVCAK